LGHQLLLAAWAANISAEVAGRNGVNGDGGSGRKIFAIVPAF
jgi:hypothetical protein